MTDPFEQAARSSHEHKQRKRIEGLRTSFRIHAAVFVLIQLLLVAVWATTGADFPWPIFAFLGWGAGLAAHGFAFRAAARSTA